VLAELFTRLRTTEQRKAQRRSSPVSAMTLLAPAPHGVFPVRISCCPARGWAAPSPSQSVARQGKPPRTIIGLEGRQSLPELACNDRGRSRQAGQGRAGHERVWQGHGRVTVQRWRSALTTGGFPYAARPHYEHLCGEAEGASKVFAVVHGFQSWNMRPHCGV
jgi:hypothetical protein